MASAQVVETSVTKNSPSQDSYHPDDLFQSRKRPFFLSANKRARRIMNLVASDSIHFEVSRGFLSSVLT